MKENVTVAELLQRHVNGTIAKDPSDDALRVYYEGIDYNHRLGVHERQLSLVLNIV